MARTVSVSITADTAGFVAGINRAAASARTGAGQIRQHFDKGFAGIAKNEQHLRTLSSQAGLLGVGLAAGVGLAVKTFADFDKSMSSVAATGQDARNNLDSLRQAAIDAGASTAFSATEAAGGLEALAKAGVTADQSLSGGLAGALSLAAAGGLGVADAAEIAATAMTQFGLAGSQVPHVADLLAAGAGKAQGEVSDLAAALKQSGLVANAYGLSIEETTGSLAAFASAGLLGSDAGTSFKTMLQALGNPSKEAAQKMSDLGISAYDAQGAFVGIGPLAEQLKTKMGGLSQETRNAALATIFGSDAVRAANVLFQEGGAGIQGWIDKVDDSGFAAVTAATKMNNLSGDIEQLKGSLETALIGLGEGANGPLRALVQGLTNVVNAFTGLSEGAKAMTLNVVGGIAGFALAAAGVTKLAMAASEAKVAMTALGISTKAAVVGIPLIGLAIAGIGAVVSHFAGAAIESAAATQEFVQALAQVEGVVTAQNAALNENVQLTAAKKLQDNGAFESAQKLGISLQTLTEAALGNAGAMDEVRTAVYAARRGNSEAVKASLDLGGQMNNVSGALEDARVKHNQLAEATRAGGLSAAEATNSYADADAALGKIAGAAGDASSSVDDLTASLFANADAALAVSDSAIGFEQAIDAAAEASKKNKHNLDISTEAGRANQQTLNQLASRGQQYVKSLVEQNATASQVADATGKVRNAYIRAAVAAGYGSKEAARLADSLGLVPKETKAAVSTPGAGASKAQVDQVRTAVKNLPKKTQAEVITVARLQGVEAARRALEAINQKQVYTYINTIRRDVKPIAPGGKPQQTMATGGYISGPGTATSDSIPAWLSDGEYVVRAAAVKAVGLAELNRLNAKGYAMGGPVGFATGGTVDVARIMRLIAQALDLEGDVRRASATYRRNFPAAARDDRRLRAAQDDVRDAKRAKDKKELAKAEDALKKAEDAHQKSAGKAKDALDALRQAQEALADAARQTADALSERYRSESLDINDVLARMREGATELAAFQAQLARLRALGLSEDQIRAISQRGAVGGGELAAQIIAGGKGLVSSLNKANANLDKAADKLGLDIEKRKSRRALGGLITGPGTGTSDSVDIRASNGEYVMRAAAVQRIGVGQLDAMNYGDRRVQPTFRPAFAGGGYISQSTPKIVRAGDIYNTFHGVNPETILRRQRNSQRDAMTLANLTAAV